MIKLPLSGVVLFGDSVLFGTGASQRKFGCGRVLRDLLPVPVAIKAKNNETTKDGLLRLKKDVLEEKDISHVIILFGNNDSRLIDFDVPLVDLGKYRENLKKMIMEIKLHQKIPIISNLQPINSEIFCKTLPEMAKLMVKITPYEGQMAYSNICNELAAAESILLADIRTPLGKNMEKVIAADGLHPNDIGHKIIAKVFHSALNPFIKI